MSDNVLTPHNLRGHGNSHNYDCMRGRAPTSASVPLSFLVSMHCKFFIEFILSQQFILAVAKLCSTQCI